MLRRFSINFAVFSMGFDALIILMALLTATYLRPSMSAIPNVAFIPGPYKIPVLLFILIPFIWVIILLFASVYDGRRNLRVWKEIAGLSLGSILAFIAIAGILYLSYRDVSRLLYIIFAFLAYIFLVLWRLGYRLAFSLGVFQSVQTRNILIIGAGDVGRELENQIQNYRNLGFELIGFLDDDPEKQKQDSDVIGNLSDARIIVKQRNIDDVVIALPPSAYQKVFSLVSEMHTFPVKVWVIPDYFNLALYKTEFEELAGLPMLDLRAPALSDYQRLVKRIFDLVISIILFPINVLLMMVIALAIKIEDAGPVFFRQKRVGENGKIFEMYKFRTMIPNAEEFRDEVERLDEEGHLIHKIINDPRVTKVGRFLRRSSLDELPQFINIFKGEMSLVGPRPELPYMVDRYNPWQYKRFAVPQGITGWWQVNGRSSKPMHLHTEDDLYYVENYSIILDLLIIIKTLFVVIKGEGAF